VPALFAVAALASVAACAGGAGTFGAAPPQHGLGQAGLRAPAELTLRPARILPEGLEDGRMWGVAPGGGARAVVAGQRVVSWPDGAIAGAVDRLPAKPSAVIEVPERMGGGFLFAMGSRIWRADSWLGRATPLLTAPAPVAQLQVGLDRMYLRTQTGSLLAFYPQRGALVGLGPLPASPALGHMAALDAWRAVAIADMRGALLTLDAGATWRPLGVPIDAADVVLLGDGIAVGGTDETHQAQWWEVRPDGQVGRLGAAPGAVAEVQAAPVVDPAVHTFGARPLVAALEDGWPLTDGTALVARDGALGRVRLTDGALVETVLDAFAMKPARCHAVSLASSHDAGAFGFVCGEARGRTVVYRYTPLDGRLVEMRHFDDARQVLAFGNGALAARGGCAPDAPAGGASDDQAFCLMPPGGAWSEMHFRGEDVDRARLVVLHDGRAALIRPPRGGDLSTMRLTLTDGAHATHAAVVMPQLRADVAHALRVGLWMDGFEERRDGVLGGWVDAGGSVMGVEIALDGHATVGTYIRAAGDVFVSGRWGLGWTASRRGMETVDGGMTWTDFDAPEPIVPAHATRERACGPVGCLAAGWMRVGWGEPEKVTIKEPPALVMGSTHPAPFLALDCAAMSGKPPEPKAGPGPRRPTPTAQQPVQLTLRGWGSGGVLNAPTVGAPELPAFMGRAAPALTSEESGLGVEVASTLERTMHGVPVARIDAWGPKSGDWDQLGRWKVYWLWPFGGWPEVRSTAIAPAPWTGLDGARRALQVSTGAASGWTLAAGDDADHALLVVRRLSTAPTSDVVMLETDHAPVEVRRPGGDPFPEVQGAERIGGRWYLATSQPAGELSATVLWLVDGAQARELARVPRAATEAHPPLRLARRADGRALGLVVDGQGGSDPGTPMRWVVAVDLDSGAVGEPEPLAAVDLSDRTVALCTGEDAGWELDVPYPGTVTVHSPPQWQASLQSPLARVRLSRERACLAHLAGTLDTYAAIAPEALSRAPRGPAAVTHEARALDVAVFSAKMRYALRCSAR